MAKIAIQIKNINSIIMAFNQAPQTVAKEVSLALRQIGVFATGEVKKHITQGTDMFKSPIDTGAMRRGIGVVQSGVDRIIIKPSQITPYAGYVHQGTRKMRARPFFGITARRSGKEIDKFFNKAIDNAIRKIVKKTI